MTDAPSPVTLSEVGICGILLRYPTFSSLMSGQGVGFPPKGPKVLLERTPVGEVVSSSAKAEPSSARPIDAQEADKTAHEPPIPKAGPGSNLLAARRAVFSKPPETLGVLLADQSKAASAFLEQLLDALTFFGGARIQPSHPHYAIAEAYGEALLLANVARLDAGLFEETLASGLFSSAAVAGARSVAISLAASVLPPAQLAHAFSVAGGDPNRLAAALAQLVPMPELELRPRTGAGPGIMHAVAKGYVEARNKLLELAPPALHDRLREGLKAQGSRMGGNLPFEQKASDAIEEMGVFLHFIPRRLALTEGAPVFSIFPGGIGTLNELFEVLRFERAVVFEGRAFWSDAISTLENQWKTRGLIDVAAPPRMAFADGVAEGLPLLLGAIRSAGPKDVRSIVREIDLLSTELLEGPLALAKFPPAVTLIGDPRLLPSAPEIAVAEALAGKLAAGGVPLRVGGPGVVFDAVHRGNQRAGGDELQAFLLDDGALDLASIEKRAQVGFVANTPIAHKPLMYENNLGIVALPGGPATLDEVFEIACLISTGNAPKRPIVLVGSEFWAPIIDAFERVMDPKGDDPGLMRAVAPGEFRRLFTIVDDEAQAMAALEAVPMEMKS